MRSAGGILGGSDHGRPRPAGAAPPGASAEPFTGAAQTTISRLLVFQVVQWCKPDPATCRPQSLLLAPLFVCVEVLFWVGFRPRLRHEVGSPATMRPAAAARRLSASRAAATRPAADRGRLGPSGSSLPRGVTIQRSVASPLSLCRCRHSWRSSMRRGSCRAACRRVARTGGYITVEGLRNGRTGRKPRQRVIRLWARDALMNN